jgi:hypothetical protein
MTLMIHLSPETESRLKELAAQRGKDVPAFVHEVLERLAGEANGARPRPARTLDEVLAPVREEFERSAMSEEELTDFLTGLRDEVRREKHLRKLP